MLSDKTTIVSELSKILPTYYELYCDSNTKLPCFTYIENVNEDLYQGDTFGYSNIGYLIKLWATDLVDIDYYSQEADSTMRTLGYKRRSTNELVVGLKICKIMNYTALGLEKY